MALAVMKRMLNGYQKFKATRPLAADAGVAGFLFLAGDLLCQTIEKKKGEDYDLKRTARMTAFGVAVMGPAAYYWYLFLDRRFPSKELKVVLQKVFWDQVIFSPPYYSSFYFIMPLLEGKSPKEAVENIKKNFLPTYIALMPRQDLALWPPAQVINFRYVAPSQRVMFVSSVCVFWNAFLSWMQHSH